MNENKGVIIDDIIQFVDIFESRDNFNNAYELLKIIIEIFGGNFHGPVAQLVEQIPLKDKVLGSNPSRPTTKKLQVLVVQWIAQQPSKLLIRVQFLAGTQKNLRRIAPRFFVI